MAEAPSRGRQLGIRLTAAEDELVRKEKKATGARSLSSVFEHALLEILADREKLAKTGLVVPPMLAVHGASLARQFRLHVKTLRLLDETAEIYGWNKQLITRAAMLRLAQAAEARGRAGEAAARKEAGDDGKEVGQSPTQTGA